MTKIIFPDLNTLAQWIETHVDNFLDKTAVMIDACKRDTYSVNHDKKFVFSSKGTEMAHYLTVEQHRQEAQNEPEFDSAGLSREEIFVLNGDMAEEFNQSFEEEESDF